MLQFSFKFIFSFAFLFESKRPEKKQRSFSLSLSYHIFVENKRNTVHFAMRFVHTRLYTRSLLDVLQMKRYKVFHKEEGQFEVKREKKNIRNDINPDK